MIQLLDRYQQNITFIYPRATQTIEIVENQKEFNLCLAVTSDDPKVIVKFISESPTQIFLCLNHAIHFTILVIFCNKTETSKETFPDRKVMMTFLLRTACWNLIYQPMHNYTLKILIKFYKKHGHWSNISKRTLKKYHIRKIFKRMS